MRQMEYCADLCRESFERYSSWDLVFDKITKFDRIRWFIWCLVKFDYLLSMKTFMKNHYSRKLVPLICNDNVPLSNSAFIFLGKFSFSELTLKNRKVESTKIEKGWRKPKTLKMDWGNLFLIFLWKKFIWNHKYRKLLFNLFKRFTLRYQWAPFGKVFNINGNHSMQTRKNNRGGGGGVGGYLKIVNIFKNVCWLMKK